MIEPTRGARGQEQRPGVLERGGGVANAPFDVKPTGPGVRNPRFPQRDEALIPRASAEPPEGGAEALDLDALELVEDFDLKPTVDGDRLVDVPAATAKNNRNRPAPPAPPPPPPPKKA